MFQLIVDNYFFIHPMVKSLCRFTSVEKFDIIAPVVEDQAMEKIACYIKGIRKNKSINTLGMSLMDNGNSFSKRRAY